MAEGLITERENERYYKAEGALQDYKVSPIAEDSNKQKNQHFLITNNHCKIDEPYFIREETHISGNSNHLYFSWLTVSFTKIEFNNLIITCKLQITARTTIKAKACTFLALPSPSNAEAIVEIFANSVGIFEECSFKNADKAAVMVRDRSQAVFKKCTFNNNLVSVLALDKSDVRFEESTFNQDSRFSIFLTKETNSVVTNCKFLTRGKSIYVQSNSKINIFRSQFDDCAGGCLTLTEKSAAVVDNCHFRNILNTVIHALKQSEVKLSNSSMENIEGNGVNFDNSNGYVYNSKFFGFEFPAVVAFGQYSNPVFDNITISDADSFAVIIRECARPIFSNSVITGIRSNAFSISDFSSPIIDKVLIGSDDIENSISQSAFSVFNGAVPLIKNCNIKKSGNIDIRCFMFGQPLFFNNTYPKDIEIFNEDESFHLELNPPKIESDIFVEKKANSSEPIYSSSIATGTYYGERGPCHSSPPFYQRPKFHTFKSKEDIELPRWEEFVLEGVSLPQPLPIISPDTLIQKVEGKLSDTCFKCKCNKGEEVLNPCGHKVCHSCASELMKEKESKCKCPLCQIPIKSTFRIFREEICSVCMSCKADTISIPCGHLCMCHECALRIDSDKKQCPICNQKNSFKYFF